MNKKIGKRHPAGRYECPRLLQKHMGISNMIIIAFSLNTSKILPRIFCRHFRHCAVIIPQIGAHSELHLYQFLRRKQIARLSLKCRDINVLRGHGWRFLYIPGDITVPKDAMRAMTCVNFTKRVIGMHAPLVQTPDALYRRLIYMLK